MLYITILIVALLKFFQVVPMDISWVTLFIFFIFSVKRDFDHNDIHHDVQELFNNDKILTKEIESDRRKYQENEEELNK